ncbi:MAG: PilZ domain-containing protein [Candidatus Hodarchaeales archaeon]|jgi:hypothetical protein
MSYEKRKFQRFDISLIIAIRSIKKTAEYCLGMTRNFSDQGFSLELHNCDLKLKESFQFTLKHPQNDWHVALAGNVVWKQEHNTKCIAGINLREMDKETKDKLSEIISVNNNMPVDLFHYNIDSESSIKQKREEKSLAKLRDKLMSETSKNRKRKIIPTLIIGLSISFFILAGIITFKALRIPLSNTYYQTTPKELDRKEHLPQSVSITGRPIKEQSGSRPLDKEFQSPVFKPEENLSNKNKETQHKDNINIIQIRSDKNIDKENILNEKLNSNDRYEPRLVYTVQIHSQKSIEDAQKQFNSVLQSLEKKHNLLRIEKVGKYYTVRLGKFENYTSAKKFLQEIKPRLSEAIILKAYIKNERIIQLYE